MKNLKYLLIILLPALFAACNNHSHHSDDGQEIELNEGRKWQVNEGMMVYVKDMENAIASFKGTETGQYRELGEQLQSFNKNIISSCTMEGKSHDELHKWLHPHMELSKELAEADNLEQARAKLEDIENSMATFNEYFE